MATVLGSVLVLHPVESLLGLALAGLVLLLFRRWDVAWSLGLASVLAWSFYLDCPRYQLLWLAILFGSLGIKKLIDRPHARRVRAASDLAHDTLEGRTEPDLDVRGENVDLSLSDR